MLDATAQESKQHSTMGSGPASRSFCCVDKPITL